MLSLRFSQARWSHYMAKSSAESKISRRMEVGIDLISKITAVYSHRHDRSPASFFLPSFLPFRSPFSRPISTKNGSSFLSMWQKAKPRKGTRTRRSASIDSAERCLGSAIEIRIEFARIVKRVIRKVENSQRVLWDRRVLYKHSKSRLDIQIGTIREIFLSSQTGSLLAREFPNRLLIKSTLI